MATCVKILEYACEVFRSYVKKGDRPSFDHCMLEAVEVFDDVKPDPAKRPCFIVLIDLRDNNGQIIALEPDDENCDWFQQFRSAEEAAQVMRDHPLGKFPYQIIDANFLFRKTK